MRKNIWIFAGGTGGHISPGISLAETFNEEKYNCNVIFFTLEKDINYPDFKKIQAETNVKVMSYTSSKIPSNPIAVFKFIKNYKIANDILSNVAQNYYPNAIIGMGGYPVFNGLLWAIFNKVPIFLCEQNSVVGRITKLFTKRAKYVFLSFPIKHKKQNHIFSGNPIRKSLRFTAKDIKPSSTLREILIIGGSQGANDLNDLYLYLIQDDFFNKFNITISTGKNRFEEVNMAKRNNDKVMPFIEDMRTALLKSDLIISRSGSGLVFEILSAKKPAIFVPFAYAIYNHQKENAQYLQQNDLAEIIDIRPFHKEKATNIIKDLITNEHIKMIQNNILKHTIPLDAHIQIVENILNNIE